VPACITSPRLAARSVPAAAATVMPLRRAHGLRPAKRAAPASPRQPPCPMLPSVAACRTPASMVLTGVPLLLCCPQMSRMRIENHLATFPKLIGAPPPLPLARGDVGPGCRGRALCRDLPNRSRGGVDFTNSLYTKGTRAHTHRELIREWRLWTSRDEELRFRGCVLAGSKPLSTRTHEQTLV